MACKNRAELLTDGPDSFIKNGLKIFLSQGRAFKILHSSDVLLHLETLLISNRGHTPKESLVAKIYACDGFTHRSRSLSIVAGSSRRSSLVPTSNIDVDGA